MFPLNQNSTSIALTNGNTFTGDWYDVTKYNYSNLVCVAVTDQDGVLYIDFSTDGSNVDESHSYTVVGSVPEKAIVAISARYARIRFLNNSGYDQTYLRIQSSLIDITIQPGETITIAARSLTGASSYVVAGLNTREDQ